MEKFQQKRLSRQVAVLLAGLAVGLPAAGASAEDAATDDDISLKNIVVTAESRPSMRYDTPTNIDVITAKEIEANHYATVGEALEHLNGVTVMRMGGQQQEIVRLNGDDRVVLLVDGERMNNDQGASTGRSSSDLNLLPSVQNIQRIEVVKGGGSALYGSDAIGGVINIITKKGTKNQTTVDMSTGSWKTHTLQVANEGKEGNFSWFVNGKLDRSGYFKYKYEGDTEKMDNSDYHNNGLSIRLDEQLNMNHSIGLRYAHRSIHASQYDCFGEYSTPGYSGSKMTENVNEGSLVYRFKETTASPGFLRLFDHYKNEVFGSAFSTQTIGLDYQNGWQLGSDHQLIAGLEWHQSKSSNVADGYEDRKITNKALYLQDTWSIGKKFTLVPGVRLDHHSNFGTHWSPKIAVNYRPDQATQFYTSYGRVFKAPTTDDLYWHDNYMRGNPDLDPESGWTATIGMNHAFNARTTMGLSFFESHLSDAIRWLPDPVTYAYSPVNINREKRRGMELTFQQKFGKGWSYDLGYSYIHTELNREDGRGYLLDITNPQPNGYRIGLHYAQGPWKANLTGRYATGLDDVAYRHSSTGIWDFNISYDIKKDWTTYFRVNNLTNAEYFNRAASYGRYYPGTGRFYQIGMTVKF